MQNFRTPISIFEPKIKINFEDSIFFIGSCFAEKMADKLNYLKFNTFSNPLGIVFNPISIGQTINRILDIDKIDESHVFYSNEMHKSFLAHSNLNEKNEFDYISKVNKIVQDGNAFLSKCTHAFITFGTAQVYLHKQESKIVANNHKLLASEFDKRMLDVTEIVNHWIPLLIKMKEFNPNLQVCFTVSPIRHLKMGAIENMLSKSILIQAIHKLMAIDKSILYFPAYEIMMDDLRDYRFYEDDMIHPNKTALNYIFELFKQNYIDSNIFDLLKEIEKVKIAIMHRPFDINSKAFHLFKQEMVSRIKTLHEKNRNLNFGEELNHFSL